MTMNNATGKIGGVDADGKDKEVEMDADADGEADPDEGLMTTEDGVPMLRPDELLNEESLSYASPS